MIKLYLFLYIYVCVEFIEFIVFTSLLTTRSLLTNYVSNLIIIFKELLKLFSFSLNKQFFQSINFKINLRIYCNAFIGKLERSDRKISIFIVELYGLCRYNYKRTISWCVTQFLSSREQERDIFAYVNVACASLLCLHHLFSIEFNSLRPKHTKRSDPPIPSDAYC